MGEFLRRLRYYVRRREFEAELEEEMLHHRAVSGARQFGNIALLKEDSRAMWTWTWVEQLGQDLRYALRSMAGSRIFTSLAVLSLALGIGATTAIYSFMESILLRSLPAGEPESLVTLNWNVPPPPDAAKIKGPREPGVVRRAFASTGASYFDSREGQVGAYFPYAAMELFQSANGPFQSVFGYFYTQVSVEVNGQTEPAGGTYVSGEYFRGLGINPAAGRLLDARDDRAGAPPVAVLSHAYWTRRFAAGAGVPGQTVRVNGHPVMVVGVAPPEFFGIDSAESPDVFFPLHSNVELNTATPLGDIAGWYTDSHFYWLEMMARLKPGVAREQAQAAMDPRFRAFAASTAETEEERVLLPALLVKEGARGLDVLRRRYSQPLLMLMTLVGLILAIACANIANLLLARAARRRREIAVRLSIGAGRWRLIRQMLTESVLLASAGGTAGIGLAWLGIGSLTALLANGREDFTLRAELNWQVLAVTAGLSLLTGLLFGLAPALRATRVDVVSALKESRAGETNSKRPGRMSLSRMLLAGQVAMSLILLVTAGLFVRTLANLESIDLGFNQENLLLFNVNWRNAGIAEKDLARYHQDLQGRLKTIPGTRNVTYSNLPLIGGGSMSVRTLLPDGREVRSSGLFVGPAFFETMQIPLLAGRGIEERDRAGAPPIAVVNRLFARTYFGNENAIGKTFHYGGTGPIEIVGITGNMHYSDLKGELSPVVLLPAAQAARPQFSMTYEVRTASDPMAQANTVRALVRQAGERITVTQVRSQEAQIARMINQEILFARLCTGFAMLALLIACLGLYGSTSYNVARRTSELGIRMAMGAQGGHVMWTVLREAALLCVIGLAIGTPVALAASRFIESFLFGMKPNDPWAVAGAVTLLVVSILAAAYGPARRASRIDPMTALRHE